MQGPYDGTTEGDQRRRWDKAPADPVEVHQIRLFSPYSGLNVVASPA